MRSASREFFFKPVAGAPQSALHDALLVIRSALQAHSLDAIPLFEGEDAALFIPLADAPAYPAVREWLTDLRHAAIEQHPALLVPQLRPHEHHTVPRIEVTVASNAPGLHSRLPYALTGTPDLPMVTPFEWPELGTLHNGSITAANAHERLEAGDLFATLTAKLANQCFADVVG